MSVSRQLSLGPMPLQNGDDYATAGSWILRCVEQALGQVMNLKTATDAMRIDRSQFRRAMNGEGHLSVARLGLLPESFWRALFYFIGNHYGWNFAVTVPVNRVETEAERLDRALMAASTNFLTIREYALRAVSER
jgi:hypothetical protein